MATKIWLRSCLALLFACLLAAHVRSQDKGVSQAAWPQWRGPAHDGPIAGDRLIDEFPEGGPPVLWIRELGPGYSGFAASGERVYTMLQTLYEQQLVCLEAATGRTIWEK
jgi:outer membrane protein assembly factor BamB